MQLKRRVKSLLLSFFRDIMLYHRNSLEFRAELLALMIAANKEMNECELILLQDVAEEIYPEDEARVDVLVRIVKEFVQKVIDNNGLDINDLIDKVQHELKIESRFYEKIDIDMLKRFIACGQSDAQTQLIQQRIIEFLELEIQNFRNLR